MPRSVQRYQSKTGTVGKFKTNAPDDYDFGEDDEEFYPVTRLRQQVLDYIAAKPLEWEEQRQARHYYHGAQWTPEEIEILRKRRQPIITFNQIARKVDSIGDLVNRLRQDPKAYPRNPKGADGAEIATQSIRYVLDSSNWEYLDNFCAVQAAIEGIAGIELKLIPGDHGDDDPDIGLDFIFGDEFFYDPRSAKGDFSDGRFRGIYKWLDLDAAIELFPDKEDELRGLMVETGFDLTTHPDREFKWIYVNEQRIRLIEHWYKKRGKMNWAFYCSNLMLDEGPSPFRDERRRPCDRYTMFSAAVDHDGDRYGFVRNLKGPQDEVNQRRSKALFISNTTRLTLEKGAVDDVETTRKEAARPDGVIEFNKGFAQPAEKDKQEDLGAHLALMQDAKAEITSFANINPAQLAAAEADSHSGVAINMLQKAGVAEIGTFKRNYRAWKWAVYRAVWNAIEQHWKAERWIRVTDNDGVKQFIQLNGLSLGQDGQPTIVNAVGALDVDIVLDEGPDTQNLMQDAYETIKDDPTIPWQIKLELMPIPQSFKKQLQQKLEEAAQQQKPDPKVQAEQIKAQTAQQSGQIELQKQKLSAQAELMNAQQDSAERTQDAAMQREREAAERQKMALELEISRQQTAMQMEQMRQEHAFKMQELQAKTETMRKQHEMKRKQMAAQAAAKPKPKGKAA